MGCALSMIALGVGYLVLLQANKEKEGLKILGQTIAILVMIGAVCSAICVATGKMGGCHHKAPMCPFSAKTMSQEKSE